MSQEPPAAHSRLLDPQTSHDAAEEVDVNRIEKKIITRLEALAGTDRVGETTIELVTSINEQRVSISPRMRELEDRGLVHESALRRRGIVWAAGPAPERQRTNKVPYRYYTRRNIRKLIIAAEKIRDYLEAQPQLTLEESVILNDHLNPALEAVGRSSTLQSKETTNGRI